MEGLVSNTVTPFINNCIFVYLLGLIPQSK